MNTNIKKERQTCQKELVLSYLRGVKNHPTADDVYNSIKDQLPRISRGTVYRILGSFRDRGLLQTIQAKEFAHFDADVSPHAHFICERCGKVYDVSDVCSKCDILKSKKTKVGKIDYFKIYFYGICKKCKT